MPRECGVVSSEVVIARSDNDEAIQIVSAEVLWIASRSLSSGARSRDPLARNDGEAVWISNRNPSRHSGGRAARARNPSSQAVVMDSGPACFARIPEW